MVWIIDGAYSCYSWHGKCPSISYVTGKTGLTLTITASKDGAAFGAITPTVTERGNGWYNLALTSSTYGYPWGFCNKSYRDRDGCK